MYGKDAIFSQYNGIPWWLMLIQGLSAVIFGVYSFIQPTVTLMFFVMIMGIYVLIEGLALLAAVFRAKTGHLKPSYVFIRALVCVMGGLFVVFNPLKATVATSLFLGFVIGFVAITNGVIDIASGLQVRIGTENDWGAVLNGVLYLLVGMFFVSTPLLSAATIGLIAGVLAIIFGSFYIYSAFTYRKLLSTMKKM